MHTEGGFRAKSAIFADFNEVRGVHTGTDKKGGEKQKPRFHRGKQENRMVLTGEQGDVGLETGWHRH